LIFEPTTTGTRTATLTIKDGASNSPQTVALSGTGTPAPTATLAISPSGQAWGAQTVGSTPPTKTFTLTAVSLTSGGTGSLSFTKYGFAGADPGDFSITGNTCGPVGSTLTVGSSCAITVAFKPSRIGNRVALLSVADTGGASPQTAEVSGAGSYTVAQTPSVTVDFGSRSGSQVAIPAGILGTEYLESLPTNANRTTVVQGGFTAARYRLQLQTIFPTSASAPNWGALNNDMNKLKAAGVSPIMEMVNTPTFLQPNPLRCAAGDTSVPTSFTGWGHLAAMIVQHMDTTFPGLAQYYEIWNEPNTAALCSANQLSDYLSIYAAAAPLMKNQNSQDIKSNPTLAIKPIFTGGPATAGVTFTSLLTNSTTAPYVDFYSYHLYVGTALDITQYHMSWDGSNGGVSLFQLETNSSSGLQARFLQAYKAVAASTLTPLKAKTPIFYDEYNDDWYIDTPWSSHPDCCRNDPTYSPLFNSIAVAQLFNSAYHGAATVPSRMIYFAAAQTSFCILGVVDAPMDCTKAATGAQAQPYPQWYTYGLMFAPSNLDLQNGGHMASSVTLSSSASSEGLIATAFYTGTKDSVLIINPTLSSFTGVTLQVNNSGLSSPSGTLFAINAPQNSNSPAISTWPAKTISASGGVQATFDLPAHSVLAISLK
jgi:hypothetical protein